MDLIRVFMGPQRLPRVLRWCGVAHIDRYAALLGLVIGAMIQRSASDAISHLDLQTEAERADAGKQRPMSPGANIFLVHLFKYG